MSTETISLKTRAPQHFLTLMDLTPSELRNIIDRAIELKNTHDNNQNYHPLAYQTLGMVFEKSSTRTRVAFETAMTQFGGHAIFLSPRDTQLGRGEPIEDTARVLSGMVNLIMIRTDDHSKIERFAAYSKVPVINALTDMYHPCQLLADMQTYIEHRGSIAEKTVTWIGDGNNMCQSYINAARQLNFKLRIACPKGYDPDEKLMLEAKHFCELMSDPYEAAHNADLIVTDAWTSMGQEKEHSKRSKDFKNYKVTSKIMAEAKNDALFMHCLPAYRGEEVTPNVIDGPQSVVWNEAENRLHAHKALLEYLSKVSKVNS